MFLSRTKFIKIVKYAPLVAIDLCIFKEGKILLGKRINPPAKNFFFVPGGRIFKSESKINALKRILQEEIGMNLKKDNYKLIKNLGVYEHFYEDNFLNNKEFSTHYIVITYLISYESLTKICEGKKIEQHSKYIWIDIDKVKTSSYLIHKYVKEYLQNPLIGDFI